MRRSSRYFGPSLRDNQPIRNPLTKWSLQLKELYQGRRSSSLRYPWMGLGLQGCRSGFNATNTLRTSLFFQTSPPTFLGLKDWNDIQHLDRSEDASREKDHGHEVGIERCDNSGQADGLTTPLPDSRIPLAWFSDTVQFTASREGRNVKKEGAEPVSAFSRTVTVALENFHRKAVSIHRFRFPKVNPFSPQDATQTPSSFGSTQIAVIAGHENNGVDQETLEKADHVVFIPQYGTISSLNVVTSIGIALYYFHLDQRGSRENPSVTVASSSAFADFLKAFSEDLPLRVNDDNLVKTSKLEPGLGLGAESPPERQRIDPRPIHPSFYQLEHNDIMKHHDSTVRDFIRQHKLVLQSPTENTAQSAREGPDAAVSPAVRIRLSLVYENQFDQRNLGGLFRLANSFLADVHYIGRRRLNRQGAVGSYLYTDKTHYATVDDFLSRNGLDLDSAPADGVLPIMMFLSCEQEFLFHSTKATEGVVDATGPQKKTEAAMEGEDDGSASLLEDVAVYERRWGTEIASTTECKIKIEKNNVCIAKWQFSTPTEMDLFLDHGDSEVTDHIRQLILRDKRFCRQTTKEVRFFILVPQEGRCPAAKLTQNCARRIRLLTPDPQPSTTLPAHRGLPAQVATGITLERLFSLLLFRG